MSEEAADKTEIAAGSGETDAKALLEAANSASERVAGQHLAFMAVCAYVLTIVFGTTDLDLLMGKGVRLPVVNVDVPIVGFYAFAPFIVVLIHFNLLLQLQLLSRKLFAFDAAAPPEEGLGGWRDRLHIFPYTYYLVGRPSPLVRPLIGLMVSITVVLLPFITLLALQLEFLSYQDEAVTWCQRLAIWLDVAVIAILWPLILHPKDDWCGYWRDLIAAHVPRRRAWLAFALLFAGFVLLLFGATQVFFRALFVSMKVTVVAGLVLLLVSALSVAPLRGWKSTPRTLKQYLAFLVAAAILSVALGFLLKSQLLFLLGLLLPLAVLWHPEAPHGSLALLLALFVGMLLPLALLVDGEGLERLVVRVQQWSPPRPSSTVFSNEFLEYKRRLYLNEQVLLAKPPKPETLALIRSGQWQEGWLKQIEPLNLQGRSLRYAQMENVILIGADLRKAQLQGALLKDARLQGADLQGAKLDYANLTYAQLQGADLRSAGLYGANLQNAQLQGADLSHASLHVANLHIADLQGAKLFRALMQGVNLQGAKLQGANLEDARLQGANLEDAWLQGADLQKAQLQGADLRSAGLYGANLREAQLQGANLEDAHLKGADLRKARLYSLGIPLNTELIDAREIVWEALADDTARALSNDLPTLIKDTNKCRQVLDRLKKASRPCAPKLSIQSCLAQSDPPLVCQKRYDPQKPEELANFIEEVHAYLGKLACYSPEIALGLLKQIPKYKYITEQDSSRAGLEVVLKTHLTDPKCIGLRGLGSEDRKRLQAIE